MRRGTALVFSVLMMASMAGAAVTVDTHTGNNTVNTGQTAVIGYFNISASNETATVTDIFVNRLPFDTTVTPTNFTLNGSCIQACNESRSTNITVSVDPGWRPGTYSGDVTFVFGDRESIERTIDVTVPEVRNVSVASTSFRENLSVGDRGDLGNLTLENTGNTRVDFAVSATGNLSEYLLYSQTLSSNPGIKDASVFKYQVPEDTPFGFYKGMIRLSAGNLTLTRNITTRFQDDIAPRVMDTRFTDFMATKPEQFVVEAVDNIAVAGIEAEVLYETVVERNNKTLVVNKTYETQHYQHFNNTNRWIVDPQGDRIRSYYLVGTVTDASGNTANFSGRYDITGLNATHVTENVEFPNFQIDKDATHPVGEVTSDTKVTVTLEEFSQPMNRENETWRVGIELPGGGRSYFSDVGDVVVMEEAGDFELYLRSSETEAYNGRLSFEGLPQHINISHTVFYGEFKNWTQPTREIVPVGDRTYRFIPIRGETKKETGWNLSSFISVDDAPEGIRSAQVLLTTQEEEMREHQRYTAQVAAAEASASKWFFWFRVSVLFSIVVLTAYSWRKRVHPTYYRIPTLDIPDYDQRESQ